MNRSAYVWLSVNRIGVSRSSRASVRLRAIWAHQVTLAGPTVTPPMRTRRVCRSMKKSPNDAPSANLVGGRGS